MTTCVLLIKSLLVGRPQGNGLRSAASLEFFVYYCTTVCPWFASTVSAKDAARPASERLTAIRGREAWPVVPDKRVPCARAAIGDARQRPAKRLTARHIGQCTAHFCISPGSAPPQQPPCTTSSYALTAACRPRGTRRCTWWC